MKKLFTNDKFFLTMVLCAVIGTAFFAGINWVFFPEVRSGLIMDVLAALCVLVLYSSYKKHSKNVMKCITGALLMLVLVRPINLLTAGSLPISTAFVMAFSILFAAVLFLNHLLINSDRHSSPMNIRFNQMLCIAIIVCHALCVALMMQYDETLLCLVADGVGMLSYICVVASIVCVESRLDAYRLDREAAGWTEEKGYPEGYVHEYEKK